MHELGHMTTHLAEGGSTAGATSGSRGLCSTQNCVPPQLTCQSPDQQDRIWRPGLQEVTEATCGHIGKAQTGQTL